MRPAGTACCDLHAEPAVLAAPHACCRSVYKMYLKPGTALCGAVPKVLRGKVYKWDER